MKRVLGLDIGIASVGWALIEEGADGPQRIAHCGVRIFESCLDHRGTPTNMHRRMKRLLRRQIARRRQRRDLLRGILGRAGLLPVGTGADPEGEASLWNRLGDVYRIRAEGLDRRLEPHEIGRTLMALAKRRGFLSNRKADRSGGQEEDDEDQTTTRKGIAQLQSRIAAAGARTLGEFLWKHGERCDAGLIVRNRLGIRHTWAERAMVLAEFEALWRAQETHHPAILTPALKASVHRAIFWQRPLKAPPRADEGCAFEPPKTVHERKRERRASSSSEAHSGAAEIDHPGRVRTVVTPRAAMAWPIMQRWRLRQSINHLRWRDPRTLEEQALTAEERELLAGSLDKHASMTWGSIRKLLKLHRGCAINLEESTGDKGMKGNTTSQRMREAIEEDWDQLDEWIGQHGSPRLKKQMSGERCSAESFAQRWGIPAPLPREVVQDMLISDLLTIDDHPTDGMAPLLRRLQEDWGFTQQEALALAETELERRPGRCSLRAARRILPHLLAGKGMSEAVEAAGYQRVDQRTHTTTQRLGTTPRLRNPAVARALTEVRRVVNAIIAKYGVPDAIRIELAREAAMSPREKAESEWERKKLEKLNAAADEWWREQAPGPTPPTRDDRVKYRLWKQQQERCLYSDRPISGTQLADGSVQVDHILPYSQSLDDSFSNKALVFGDLNAAKGQRTPREWLGDEGFAELVSRATHLRLPRPVLRRLMTEKIEPEKHHQRALNDTRWMTRAVLSYLRQLSPSHAQSGTMHQRVEAPRGTTTAALRHQWGLSGALGGGEAKNRDDHRHHALDAIVVACTSRRVYQQAAARFHIRRTPNDVPAPWEGFRSDVIHALRGITVSHAIDHRVRDALHEDSAFGLINKGRQEESFVIRKSVADLSPEKAKLIIDPVVRERVQESFARHGSPKKAAEAGIFHMDGRTPIRKARVRELLKRPALFPYRRGGVEIRFHRLRNNYRLDIMSTADGKYRVRMVCMLDHARATRLWERATCRGQDPLAVLPAELKSLRDGSLGKAVLQLHRGDLVGVDGLVCRVDSFSASGNVVDVVFRSHTDAAPAESAKQQRIRTVKELLARVQPIHVSILGEVSHDSTHGRSGKSGASTPG